MTVASAFLLDPEVVYLNHGSFGACPRAVLEHQSELRARIEREPVHFFVRELPGRLDAAREAVARFVRAQPEGLAFVPNATTGVNAILRSLRFEPGDELLTTDHAYNACANALRHVADRSGARVVVASLPFPTDDPQQWVAALEAAASPRTRIALVDHVTSPTAVVLPMSEIVASLQGRGIDVLVDGAHAPGMLDLDVDGLGAAYYVGNCHKWLCAPKGAGILWVRADRRAAVQPTTISHGANAVDGTRTRFRLEFDWTGTDDPTAALCVPVSIATLEGLVPGGWPAIRAHNHALALEGRDILVEALGLERPPVPAARIGAMVALPLAGPLSDRPSGPFGTDPLQDELWERHRIEVPVFPFRPAGRRMIRISAQIYNSADQYRRLAAALRG